MALQLDNLNALHLCGAYKNHDAKIQKYQKERRKRIMKNKKIMRMLIVGASIFALAGCGTSNDMGTNGERKTKDTYIENDITNPDKKDASDENDSKDTSNVNNSKDTPNGDNPKNIPDENNPQNTPDENNPKNTPDGNDSNAVGSMDGDELITASDLQGSVTEFSDNGCTINPATSDNNGEAVIAADGYEDEGAKVTIKYGDNCIFQRAVMSIGTGNATVSEAAKADIKKKTSLLLYGNFDDTENFTAAKVVIVQYEHE